MLSSDDLYYTWPFWGPFLMQTNIEGTELFNFIKENAEDKNLETEERNFQKRLAGKIKKEFKFEDKSLDNLAVLIAPYVYQYLTHASKAWSGQDEFYIDENYMKCVADSAWVNIQEKNEYNPIHNHSGDISWVTYLEIDERMYKEEDLSVSCPPGSITFHYGNNTGLYGKNFEQFRNNMYLEHIFTKVLQPTTMRTFQPKVGDIFFFPSYLLHSVDAFKSDIRRVSASGNIHLMDPKE